MKIEHLLELDATPNSPLGRARAIEKEKADAVNPAVGGVPNLNATKGLPQATTNSQSTTLGAPQPVQFKQTPTAPATDQTETPPAVWKNNRNLDAPATTKPGAVEPKAPAQDTGSNTVAPDATGRVDPTFSPDELDAYRKNAGLPLAVKEPEQLQATPDEEPAADPKAEKGPGALKRFWDYANTDKSGEDALKFGRGMADAGAAVGQGVANAANAAATGVQGISNLAAQTAGGVTSTLGAAAGGLKHGYQTAAAGQRFGAGDTANTGRGAERLGQALRNTTGVTQARNGGNVGGSGYTSGGGSAGNGMSIDAEDELTQLKSTVQAIDQRLKRANI
jgi:hypothetical protein